MPERRQESGAFTGTATSTLCGVLVSWPALEHQSPEDEVEAIFPTEIRRKTARGVRAGLPD